jgi:F-type H+-transporting ATPase subunit epsilon
MAATYRFKILTPKEEVLNADVSSMVAPGEAGYLGVLANHAPLITTLNPGTLKVRLESEEKWFRVAGGILRVAKNEAVLLSEAVEEIPVDHSS